MPRGDKSAYTDKQKRQAKHIEDSATKSGKSSARAKQIAYATINKQDGGGKKSGSGRGHKVSHASSRKGGKNSHASAHAASRSRKSASHRTHSSSSLH